MSVITETGKIILSLLQLPGIGRKSIIRYCEIPKNQLCEYCVLDNILENAKKKTTRFRSFSSDLIYKAIESAEKITNDCIRHGIEVVSFMDPDYPGRLLNIDDPAAILFYRGTIDFLNQDIRTVAIIGTLTPTAFGYRIAERIGEMVTDMGFISVSGLARGCDTGGHSGSVGHNGRSVAVLANGLEKIYPEENKGLAKKIIDCGGCLISEYPPYTLMQKGYFVDRDRIQAALSDAVFVVETGTEDGTMHTVSFAQKYGKQIYCFRHPEKYRNETSVLGNSKLFDDGIAKPIENQHDLNTFISAVKTISYEPTKLSSNYEQLSML